MRKAVRIRAYYPNYFGDDLIAYVSLRIVKYFNDRHVRADVMGICSDRSVIDFKRLRPLHAPRKGDSPVWRRIYRDAFPPGLIWAVARRILNPARISAIAEFIFFKTLKKGDIVYLWPGASVDLYRKIHASGYVIVSERINTLLSTSKRILDEEYKKLGIHPGHGLTLHALKEESSCMSIADYIFSPSPAVAASIIAAGIPGRKILKTSYGLEDHEILTARTASEKNRPLTAIFVGTVCVRKGIHLLLEAWVKADIEARLVIVGRISPEAESMLDAALKVRSDIEHMDFVEDLEPVYRSADFMILPSLEEGSPLVTYLALGARLPLIVSAMGGGGVIEHMREGFVIDPHDTDAFADAIATMVNDEGLRSRMSEAAGARASRYTWDRVSRRRRDLLLSRVYPLTFIDAEQEFHLERLVPERMG